MMKIQLKHGMKDMKLLDYPKRIAYWHGTDALKLVMYPPGSKLWYVRIFLHRIFWKVFHRFFDHWVNSQRLIPYLREFGIKNKIELKPVPHPKYIFKRIPHYGFNILFYLPKSKSNQKYKNWIYGKTYIQYFKTIEGIDLIIVDGSADMERIYPVIDVYVKINQHRGSAINRIGKECIDNNIPVLQVGYHGLSLNEAIDWININKDI